MNVRFVSLLSWEILCPAGKQYWASIGPYQYTYSFLVKQVIVQMVGMGQRLIEGWNLCSLQEYDEKAYKEGRKLQVLEMRSLVRRRARMDLDESLFIAVWDDCFDRHVS